MVMNADVYPTTGLEEINFQKLADKHVKFLYIFYLLAQNMGYWANRILMSF